MGAKKKIEEIKALSDWEWDLTWSSLRYFCGRYTIASAVYPSDLIKNFGDRLSDDQKITLSGEIQREIDTAKRTDDNLWLTTDMEPWSALRNYFDKKTWKELHCSGEDIEDQIVIAFPCERKDDGEIVSRWIPIEKYKNLGTTSTSVYEPYIKQIKDYEPK